jgi:hypothetical protein
MSKSLAEAQAAVDTKIAVLLDRISDDDAVNGGLLDRLTIRAADELRLAVAARDHAKQREAAKQQEVE